MKVIGIDPAPAKKTVIYNDVDGFTEIEADKLKEHLDDKIKKLKEDVLICWDAPLTGGFQTNSKQKKKYNPFYQRKIEQLINEKVKEVSTLPYAGCSHWAITQHCFGLPLINDEFKPIEPTSFKLITNQDEREKPFEGKYIVEVHPALALWLWLKGDVEDLNYKGGTGKKRRTSAEKKEIIKKIIIKLNEKWSIVVPKNVEKDDHLDAYIAWKLGDLWQNENEKVILVGNENTGAMLLPNVEDAKDLKKKLKQYK